MPGTARTTSRPRRRRAALPRRAAGEDAVRAFARRRVHGLLGGPPRGHRGGGRPPGPGRRPRRRPDRARATPPRPRGRRARASQLCQHHCPVAARRRRVPRSCARPRPRRSPSCWAPTSSGWPPSRAATPRAPPTSRRRSPTTTRQGKAGRMTTSRAERTTAAPPPRELTQEETLATLGRYEFGWPDTDVAGATAQRGLSAAVVADISQQEERAGLDARAPAQGAGHVRAQADAALGRRPVGHRLRQHQVLRALDGEAGRHLGRPARRHQEHLRQARHPRGREGPPGVRCRRAVRVRGRLPPDPRGPRGAGRHLHGHRHRAARAPGAVRGVLRLGDPGRRQQVLRAELGGVVRRLVHLRAARASTSTSRCRPTSGSTPRTWASSSAR